MAVKNGLTCRLIAAVLIAQVAGYAALANDASFYSLPASEVAGSSGSLIRQEPMPGAPSGSVATRILYRTTDTFGAPVAASGVVIVPTKALLYGTRPLIVWAHPTTGVMPPCAPSLIASVFDKVQGLREMLDRGYAIVAPDYPGLGTAGPHAYLVGDAVGWAILDSVRAVKTLPAGTGNGFAVWGHSQGGHAAIFTGLVAKSYAPELDLVGVAAAAPATSLGTLLRDDYATPLGKILTAMAVRSWAWVFAAPIEQIVDKTEISTVERVGSECIESKFEALEAAFTEAPLQKKFLIVPDITTVEPWRGIIAKNTPGPLPRSIPLLMVQGLTDVVVEPVVTQSFVRRQCDAGSAVRFMQMPGIGHNPIARDTAAAAVQWMAERFAGLPPPSDCG